MGLIRVHSWTILPVFPWRSWRLGELGANHKASVSTATLRAASYESDIFGLDDSILMDFLFWMRCIFMAGKAQLRSYELPIGLDCPIPLA